MPPNGAVMRLTMGARGEITQALSTPDENYPFMAGENCTLASSIQFCAPSFPGPSKPSIKRAIYINLYSVKT